jgi:hypothetical protein
MTHLWPIADLNDLARQRQAKSAKATVESRADVWRVDPVLYARERLGIELTEDQTRIVESIRDNRRTAVKASHAIGKTFLASTALNWWFDCWPAHIGYITAPTWSQALGLTFKQTKKMRMLSKLPGDILDSGLIRDTERLRQTDHFVKALNAENGEGFQGEHSAPILIVIEEAVGVPNYIWDAMEGLMTHPACRVLAIGNPTDEASKFGEICESPHWEVFSVSALNHPNIVAELQALPPIFEDAVRLQWLFEQLRGETEVEDGPGPDCFEFYTLEVIEAALNGHPVTPKSPKCYYRPTAFFQGRVLGEFPTEASNKVIPSGWIKHLPVADINLHHPFQLGCDVARFGDDRTTIFARNGSALLEGKELRKFDNLAIVSAIKDMLKEVQRRFGVQNLKRIPINIDITGGLGTGPYDILKSEGYNVFGINSSEQAKDPELYRNVRSELWFDMQRRAKEKRLDLSRLSPDLRRKLEKELSTPTYKVLSGKKVVEEKADIKKRLGVSPDLADGVNLTYYEAKPKAKLYGF